MNYYDPVQVADTIRDHDIKNTYTSTMVTSEYGEPLWHPEPGSFFEEEAQVGDVGVSIRGAFLRLFNVLRPSTDVINSGGVTEGFEQVEFPEGPIKGILSEVVRPGGTSMHSTNVKITPQTTDNPLR